MNLLLTSAGLRNDKITKALLDLVDKEAKDTSCTFVVTAANVEKGEKGWLIDDLHNFHKRGFKKVYIVDLAVTPREIWSEQIKDSDVVCFGGGYEQYLADVIDQSGDRDHLINLLKDRVYMGISAGSMMAGKFLDKKQVDFLFSEDDYQSKGGQPFEFVDFSFLPHLNSPHFPKLRQKEVLEKIKDKFSNRVYACDDETALQVKDGQAEVIGDGEYWIKDN